MSRRAHLCFIALAMLALGWAQVFGLTRGYLCHCSGVQEITPFDHCHSLDGFGCHHEDEPRHTHENHEDESTHEHTLLKESLDSQLLSFPQVITNPWVITEMPVENHRPVIGLQIPLATFSDASDTTLKRRWPQVLTRTIALRV